MVKTRRAAKARHQEEPAESSNKMSYADIMLQLGALMATVRGMAEAEAPATTPAQQPAPTPGRDTGGRCPPYPPTPQTTASPPGPGARAGGDELDPVRDRVSARGP